MLALHSIGSRWVGSGRSTDPADFVTLSGSASVALSATANADAGITLSGQAAIALSAAGVLDAIQVSQAVAEATATASMVVRRGLAGQAAINITATGNAGRRLSMPPGSASVKLDVSASLTHLRSLRGSASVNLGASGSMGQRHAMSGDASAALSASALLTAAPQMSGSAAITLTANGLLLEFVESVPDFRLIRVDEPNRDILAEEKVREIEFIPDDEGLSMETKIKQPGETVDYTIDMRRWFRKIRTDFITQVAVTIAPTGDADDLAKPSGKPDWQPVGDPVHRAQLWFEGGRNGITYHVTATVTTDDGRIEEVDFEVEVEEQ